jgi:hypothetical protein
MVIVYSFSIPMGTDLSPLWLEPAEEQRSRWTGCGDSPNWETHSGGLFGKVQMGTGAILSVNTSWKNWDWVACTQISFVGVQGEYRRTCFEEIQSRWFVAF